jgi:tetratricopeptide (TPR) repeat protein
LKKAAQIYLEQKDAVNCRRCLDSISQIQATQRRAVMLTETENFLNQAINKVKQGNYQGALGDFNWLLQVDPQNAKAWCYRGVVRCKLGNHQGAIQDLAQAMQLNPEDAQVRNHRGLVRIQLGDYRGAIDDFSQLLQSQPNNIEAYINRGHAYRKLGDYRQAIEDYSRALSLQPDEAQIYCHRAVARFDFQDRQGAVDDYQKAANIYFDKQDWSNYQQVLDKLKSLPPSRSRSEKATQFKFGDSSLNQVSSSSQLLSELQNRLLRLVGGYWDVATRLIDLAKQKYPGMPEDWYWEKVIEDIERDR